MARSKSKIFLFSSFFDAGCFLVRKFVILTTWFLGDYTIQFSSTTPYVFDAFQMVMMSGFAGSTPVWPTEWRHLLYQVGRDLNKYLGTIFPESDGLISRLKSLWRYINEGIDSKICQILK